MSCPPKKKAERLFERGKLQNCTYWVYYKFIGRMQFSERLNSVMTLHVHKDLLDCIVDSAVVKDFVACNEVRKDIFGKGPNLPATLDIQ